MQRYVTLVNYLSWQQSLSVTVRRKRKALWAGFYRPHTVPRWELNGHAGENKGKCISLVVVQRSIIEYNITEKKLKPFFKCILFYKGSEISMW